METFFMVKETECGMFEGILSSYRCEFTKSDPDSNTYVKYKFEVSDTNEAVLIGMHYGNSVAVSIFNPKP